MSNKAERTEKISILMTLDASAYEKHKEAVHLLAPNYQDTIVHQSDTFLITYKFRAVYNDVVKQLQAVEELCNDPNVITSVGCTALEKQRCLVYRVLKKLDNIIQKAKRK